MWAERSHRLALLELAETGELRRRRSNAAAWDELLQVGWARRTSRGPVLALAERDEVEGLLERMWPGWRQVASELRQAGLSYDERGLDELELRQRASRASALELPARLNRHTQRSLHGRHSKARSLRPSTLVESTEDWLLRLRPNPGLRVRLGERSLEGCEVAAVLGELAVGERALRQGLAFEGVLPRAVLTVENLGAFVDLPPPEGWLVAFVPGWDTAPARALLDRLGSVPFAHFGDLDPAGVAIVRHLRRLRPDLAWVVPDFALEYPPLEKAWPEGLLDPQDPPLLHELARAGRWLEQEALVLDPRLLPALEACLVGR